MKSKVKYLALLGVFTSLSLASCGVSTSVQPTSNGLTTTSTGLKGTSDSTSTKNSSTTSSTTEQGDSSVTTSTQGNVTIAKILKKYSDHFVAYTSSQIGQIDLDGTVSETPYQTLYTQTYQSRDYLGQVVLQSFKGLPNYSKSGFFSKESYTDTSNPDKPVTNKDAAVMTTVNADGSVTKEEKGTSFLNAYAYPFDLLGETDFFVNEVDHTATLYDINAIYYFLSNFFQYANDNLAMTKAVFHYSPDELVFTSVDFQSQKAPTSSSAGYWVNLHAEFDNSATFEKFVPSISEEEPEGLSAALKASETSLKPNNYTLEMKVSTSEGANQKLISPYVAYSDPEDGLIWIDLTQYQEEYGYHTEYLAKYPSGVWYDTIYSRDADKKITLTSTGLKDEEVQASFKNLSAKLFKDEKKTTAVGESLYGLKDPRLVGNNSTLFTDKNFKTDSYSNYSSANLLNYELKVKDGKVTGWVATIGDTESHTYTLDYTLKDIGTTKIPAEDLKVQKKAIAYDLATAPEDYTNYVVSGAFAGKTLKISVKDDKAKVEEFNANTKAYDLIGYLGWGVSGSYSNRPTAFYSKDKDGNWAITNEDYFGDTTNSLTTGLFRQIGFPSNDVYVSDGTISDDYKTISISKDKYVLHLNDDGLLIDYTSKADDGTSSTFAFSDYGAVKDITLPTIGSKN